MLRTAEDSVDQGLERRVEAYLRDSFGLPAAVEPCRPENLPYFVADRYAFWRTELVGRACILMAVKTGTDPSADEMARHVDMVRARTETALVILVFPALTAARRKGLLGRRLAFLVPGAQLFVPEALLELRERTPRVVEGEIDRFSPTAQLLILGALLGGGTEASSATAIAHRYGVAIMSVTRAFDELERGGLARAGREGRERRLAFKAAGRALWDLAAPRLRTPVRKVRTVLIQYPERFPGRLAGESALARYTSLAPPRITRLAVASAQWRQLVQDQGLRETERGDPAGDEIETWTYDPHALAGPPMVDPLSLHLSLGDHPDERVAGAAEALLDAIQWS